ncbi:hypothetical protein Barb6XT_02866 [Bacteroidales bacterium Barb6XT]|nr:hypothetical protein Barb6XT_02866 [Bacteroidales bacterium Barb6XT]
MVIGGAAGAAGGVLGAGMPAFGAAAAALSGVASIAAASLIGSTTSFLTGENTLSVGLLSYNFSKGGLENPFGSVQQSIFSSLDIAGMVLPAVGGVASALTKTARGAASAEASVLSPENRQRLQAVWEDKHPRGKLLGGADPVPVEEPMRKLSPLTHRPVPPEYTPGLLMGYGDVLAPQRWRLRDVIYRSRRRNTKFWHHSDLPTHPSEAGHQFRTTDTHFMRVLAEERDNFTDRHLEAAFKRITKNRSPRFKALARENLNYMQRHFVGVPYYRLSRKNFIPFGNTYFEPVSILNLKTNNWETYISVTMPKLRRIHH